MTRLQKTIQQASYDTAAHIADHLEAVQDNVVWGWLMDDLAEMEAEALNRLVSARTTTAEREVIAAEVRMIRLVQDWRKETTTKARQQVERRREARESEHTIDEPTSVA